MAVGKQNEATIVHWHPGEGTGKNGLGLSTSVPENIVSSGALLIISEDFASTDYVTSSVSDLASTIYDVVSSSVSTLRAELVASGVL